jgi:lauroyl/myristoyl acyltransferase
MFLLNMLYLLMRITVTVTGWSEATSKMPFLKNLRRKENVSNENFIVIWLKSSRIGSANRILTERTCPAFRFKNPELINSYARQGKSVLLATAHYANWEWFSSFPPISPFKVLAIYKPLRNPLMDKLLSESVNGRGLLPAPWKML